MNSRDRLAHWIYALRHEIAPKFEREYGAPMGWTEDLADDLSEYLAEERPAASTARCEMCGDALPPPSGRGPRRRYCPRPRRCRDRAAANHGSARLGRDDAPDHDPKGIPHRRMSVVAVDYERGGAEMARLVRAAATREQSQRVFDTEVGKTYLDNLRRLHVSERTKKAIEAAVDSERANTSGDA